VDGIETTWQTGKCLAFDDSFVHEVWNEGDRDRVVLVVDVWHPDLSDHEVSLLEGLHRYAFSHASGLLRYWDNNDRAARTFLSTPANGEPIRVTGPVAAAVVCRIERGAVVPHVGPGGRLAPRDVVLAVDRGPLHFRYGLVWETAARHLLGASVAAWSQDDPVPGYLHVSGRTATERSAGRASFVVFLPAGEHQAMRARVDVAPNGSAKFNARSLALVADGPIR
jgi:hypothetical protein